MEYPTILTVIATALAILGFMWRVDARWQDRFNDMQKELSAIKECVAHVEGILSGARASVDAVTTPPDTIFHRRTLQGAWKAIPR
ncbi:MAG: hypothetical protein OXM58_03625 [Rhodospirillaceae bacterium]|nr:hypothetical protein [Rhodospirillaceae bacterium]MDE0617051.1 hypothetical protein [Rhodospirillaceae bacterium]